MTLLPRRRVLAWVAAVAAYPWLAAHHRPNHNRGKGNGNGNGTTTSGDARVTWAEFETPAATGGEPSATIAAAVGGASAVFPAGGFVEVVET